MREFLQILLERDGHDVSTAQDVGEALLQCGNDEPDLVFSDLKLPDGSGLQVLRHVRDNHPASQVIMLTAFGSTENVVEAMRLGAYDYQIKPVKVDEVRAIAQKALEKVALIRENRQLSAQLRSRAGRGRFVGRSARMVEVLDMIDKVAPSRANVLVEGESGTGKELVARAIHDGSSRSDGPFVPVNCGAIPETLIEAELFGHAAGAFTGAQKARAGLFEAAHGGTVLLDEVGELPGPMQVKLLRVIQERGVRRVGEDRERAVDVRIIAATNRDLQRMVDDGEFREDLFYRLNVVRIRVPPLKERREDIAPLVRVFIAKYAEECGKDIEGIAPDALRALTGFNYPGNVRELENYMERAVTLAGSSMINLDDLPDALQNQESSGYGELFELPEGGLDLEQTLTDIEKHLIHRAMDRAGGVKTKAAELLGLSFRSFRYRMQKLGLNGNDTDEVV